MFKIGLMDSSTHTKQNPFFAAFFSDGCWVRCKKDGREMLRGMAPGHQQGGKRVFVCGNRGKGKTNVILHPRYA